jgi:hypothetical protein
MVLRVVVLGEPQPRLETDGCESAIVHSSLNIPGGLRPLPPEFLGFRRKFLDSLRSARKKMLQLLVTFAGIFVNLLLTIAAFVPGSHISIAATIAPDKEQEKEAAMPGIPFLLNQGSQPSVRLRAQIVRALDAATGLPIQDAAVTVRLPRRSAGNEMICKEGRTNSQGLFVFTFEEENRRAQVFISVDAEGYWGIDDESRLADERVIRLYRTSVGSGPSCESERALRMDMEHCGRLLLWPS